MNPDGRVKTEVRLSADQTKGRHPRTVFLPQRLQTELQEYLDIRKPTNPAHPLFVTAGRRAFSANVLDPAPLLALPRSRHIRCQQPLRAQNIHHQLGKQRHQRSRVSQPGWAQVDRSHAKIH
jgi:hypothetical protein